MNQPPIRKHDAWKHQLEAYHFAAPRSAAMLAMDMGTGKTKVAVDLAMNSGVEMTLVLCPKSVLGVWRREIAKHWNTTELDEPTVLVLDKGTTVAKAAQLDVMLNYRNIGQAFVVVNYETAWREPLASKLLKADFGLVIGDESHRIKAPGGKASRFMQKLGLTARKRLCLTGTPMPHSPLDLYGQFRFLKPEVFGTSFARFRSRYAICSEQFPSQVRKWINQEDLQAKFHANSFICSADEVLDLPEATHNDRFCQLDPKTMRVYRDLEKNLIAEVEAGTIVAANALTKLLRLQQCTSGFVTGRDDRDEQFAEHLGFEKLNLLCDLLEDINRPVVVFCRFRRDLDAVESVAARMGRRYGELSGRRRDAINDHSCMSEEVDVAGVQIQSGGVGIDLTRANYAFYYSIGYNLGDYLQSLARLHRPGQKHPVFFYHLIAEGTVDEIVYKALAKRQEVINTVINELGSESCLLPK